MRRSANPLHRKELDLGPRPPDSYQDLEADFIRIYLKNPESAKFKFGEVVPGTIPAACNRSNVVMLWTNIVQVKTTSSLGASTDYQSYTIAWRDSQIAAIL